MSKRQRLRLLTSLIAAGCIFVGGIAITSAATMEQATESNYIAINVTTDYLDNNFQTISGRPNWAPDSTTTKKDGYTYILREVTLPDTNTSKYYWVREGYNITATNEKYFEKANAGSFKLDAYATSATPSKEHLVFSSKNGIIDTTAKTVINNDTLHRLTYEQYGAATNTSIPTPSYYNYYIQRDGNWFDAGGSTNNLLANSAIVSLDNATGYYQYNGQNIPFENVYYIQYKDTDTYQSRVFLNSDGTVYTGTVYGANNEILITAYDKESDTWSSVWGMQITDPNATIGSMTMEQFNNVLTDIHNEDVILSNADIKTTVAESTGNSSGTLYLKNKAGNAVPGITVTASGGTGGADKKITFSDTESGSFSLTTGSIVAAKTITDGKLTALSINGTDYLLGGTGTTTAPTEVKAGKNISVTQAEGQNLYTVATADDVSFTTVSVGSTVILSSGGINMGSQKITNLAAGTADTDAVNVSQLNEVSSQANKYATVDTDSTNLEVSSTVNGNETKYTVSMKNALDLTANGSVSIGNTFLNNSGLTAGNVKIDATSGKITGLTAGTADTDAVNVSQLNEAYNNALTEASKHTTVSAGDNISVTETNVNGQKDYKVSLTNDIALDQGKITTGNISIDGTEGTITAGTVKIDGTTGTISGLTNTTWNGTADDVSRAATEGQLQDLQTKINGDITNISTRINTLEGETIVGGTGNDDGTITLNKSDQSTATITGLHDYALKEGQYKADKDGNVALTVKDRYSDGVYYVTIEDIASKENLNSLTSAIGADSKETVKESYSNTYYIQDKDTLVDADVQLDKEIKQNRDQIISNSQNIQNLNNGLNSLSNRMNKVGAGASALAALHPMDFDPDDKLNFSAGVGNYAGSTAAAIGAFYRPNERVMFSIGGTLGNGEEMVNAGVSFALGKGGKINNTRVAMAHEITELRQQVAVLTAMFNELATSTGYKLDKIADFPDVPQNHWAYEYVGKLAAAGIIEGYPDGNFGGDRAMTRYEFATMLFKAIEKGVSIDERMLDEFEPEIGRLHVERIKGEQNSRQKIERVRLNDKDANRDVYGGKINIGKTW